MNQVIDNCSKLKRCTSLEEEDLMRVRNFQQLAKIVSSILCDLLEGLSSVTHLHNTHASTLIVYKVSLRLE